MHPVSSLMGLLRAILCAVVNVLASEPAVRVVEVRPDEFASGWRAQFKGRKSALLISKDKECAIEDATELLRKKGGGEIMVVDVVNGKDKIAQRVWVLPSHKGIARGTPMIGRKKWHQQRGEGWKFFCNLPTFGRRSMIGMSRLPVLEPKASDRFGTELIDLLQSLIGRDNVTTGNASEGGIPSGVPEQIGLYVRCSNRDLAMLRKSERWFSFCSLHTLVLPIGAASKVRTRTLLLDGPPVGLTVPLGELIARLRLPLS
jgi:hypothetical protein